MSTVLVVDDRPDARYSMARPLAAAGFDVRETATGRDALRLARMDVHAIVLDLVLPDLDGYEVLRRLNADPATTKIRVILKTAAAHLEDGYRQLALDAGAADYFAEPFDPQALVLLYVECLLTPRHPARHRRRDGRSPTQLPVVSRSDSTSSRTASSTAAQRRNVTPQQQPTLSM